MNKFKNFIENIGLNFSKEITKIGIINGLIIVLMAVSLLLYNQTMIALYLMFSLLFVNYYFYYQYQKKERQNKYSKDLEFVMVFSYIQVFLCNGLNVYQSLLSVVPYCSYSMQDKMQKFLKEIDEDKTIMPFHNFSKNFYNPSIEQAMTCIYLVIENGSHDEFLTSFTPIFGAISDIALKEATHKKEKNYNSLNLFPLVGAALITLIIIVSIASIIGGIVSGL